MSGTGDALDGGTAADANVRDVVWTMLGARREKPVELALRLGLSKSAIYSRLSGKTAFTVSEIAAMSEHFDLPPGIFFAGNSALLVAGSRPKIVPGSIKNRGLAASASPARPTGRLSLVAA